jgi:hypothetical protein
MVRRLETGTDSRSDHRRTAGLSAVVIAAKHANGSSKLVCRNAVNIASWSVEPFSVAVMSWSMIVG